MSLKDCLITLYNIVVILHHFHRVLNTFINSFKPTDEEIVHLLKLINEHCTNTLYIVISQYISIL